MAILLKPTLESLKRRAVCNGFNDIAIESRDKIISPSDYGRCAYPGSTGATAFVFFSRPAAHEPKLTAAASNVARIHQPGCVIHRMLNASPVEVTVDRNAARVWFR